MMLASFARSVTERVSVPEPGSVAGEGKDGVAVTFAGPLRKRACKPVNG
jgi:hypothetical protein